MPDKIDAILRGGQAHGLVPLSVFPPVVGTVNEVNDTFVLNCISGEEHSIVIGTRSAAAKSRRKLLPVQQVIAYGVTDGAVILIRSGTIRSLYL